MSPLDDRLLARKCDLIMSDLDKLELIAHLPREKFLDDFDVQLRTERLLERIIGRLIDINFHVLKEKHRIVPKRLLRFFCINGTTKGG